MRLAPAITRPLPWDRGGARSAPKPVDVLCSLGYAGAERDTWMNCLKSAAANAALVVGSIILSLSVLEGALWLYAKLHVPPLAQVVAVPAPMSGERIAIPSDLLERQRYRDNLLTMPPEFERRPAHIEGAFRAEYWQGELHVYNEDFQRHIGPYPPKRRDVFRVLIMGDSLTYGDGIGERQTYTALLNQWLESDGQIEFLNLGAPGLQSEDILRSIKKFVPELKPDLVIYGICLNDFLPSGIGQYGDLDAYALPFPSEWKSFLMKHTHVDALMSDLYDAALRSMRLRKDFYIDILSNFGGYKERFAKDLAKMNQFITESGLPPLITLVLDQYPWYGRRGYQIAKAAEDAAAKAGAVVIATEDYYRQYDGKAFFVTRWEGHPDEIANYIWASMIANELRGRQVLPSRGENSVDQGNANANLRQ
jgi:lysophospholipase L1-like esterase